jgi:hypothetical protein
LYTIAAKSSPVGGGDMGRRQLPLPESGKDAKGGKLGVYQGMTMHDQRGRRLPLSIPRRIIGDLVHFARQVPTVPVQRVMQISHVVEARDRSVDRPSWCAIFTKAFAVVAGAVPELRRCYLAWPCPHLYEHPVSIASVAIEREYQGEPGVFFAHIRSPDEQSLVAIDEHLRRFKEEPLQGYGLFRRALFVGRLPWPLRRLLWWVGLNSSGYKRARRLGTFGVTVYSSLGAESLHPLSPLTATLNYGVIAPDGRVTVRIVYDHRTLDGAVIARALALMERVLNGEILAELRGLAARAAA